MKNSVAQKMFLEAKTAQRLAAEEQMMLRLRRLDAMRDMATIHAILAALTEMNGQQSAG